MSRNLSAADSLRTSLEADGFLVFPEALPLETLEAALQNIKTSQLILYTEPSFGASTRDTSPRHQLNHLDVHIRRNPERLLELGRLLDTITERLSDGERECTDWRLIGNVTPVKQQADHCDYNPSRTPRKLEHVPLIAMVALTADCAIHVCPRTHAGNFARPTHRVRVSLRIGDIFVMRGDLVHAGAAYEQESWRLHVIFEPKSQKRFPSAITTVRVDLDSEDLFDEWLHSLPERVDRSTPKGASSPPALDPSPPIPDPQPVRRSERRRPWLTIYAENVE